MGKYHKLITNVFQSLWSYITEKISDFYIHTNLIHQKTSYVLECECFLEFIININKDFTSSSKHKRFMFCNRIGQKRERVKGHLVFSSESTD